MNQVWVLKAFIGDSTEALTYAYILLESKLAESYSLKQTVIRHVYAALSAYIWNKCPLLSQKKGIIYLFKNLAKTKTFGRS